MTSLSIILGLIIYLAVIGILLARIIKIRRGGIYKIKPGLTTMVEPKIDKLAYYVVIFTKEAAHYSYVFLLLLIEEIIKLAKFVVIKIEKRFSRIVNQVRGKGEIGKRGSVSLFLREVKDHRDKVRSGLGNNIN